MLVEIKVVVDTSVRDNIVEGYPRRVKAIFQVTRQTSTFIFKHGEYPFSSEEIIRWKKKQKFEADSESYKDTSNSGEIVKDLYKQADSITKRPQAEVDKYLSEREVTLKGDNIPRPYSKPVKKLLLASYSEPTTIQGISWPLALSGKDIISIAKTGSGKTLGFILPAIVHILNQSKRNYNDGPTVLVLLPTRELAQQVEEVAKTTAKQ
uniref:Helicase ATP-binding domain-containing protein n=1 Tax=Ditylenchus dipsaci TaxID=166011 RepID=A0A915DU71_9BILA